MAPRTAVAIGLVVLLVSCAPSRARAAAPGDLARIVLQAAEAPPGTARSSLSGPRDLGSFARDAAEERALRSDGFRAAYVAYFPPLSYFEKAAPGVLDRAVQVVAVLFETPGGAGSTLHRYVGDLRGRQMPGATGVPTDDLGEDAIGLQGAAAIDGSPLVVLAWRRGDLVLVLMGSGPFTPDEVTRLARRVDGRARRFA